MITITAPDDRIFRLKDGRLLGYREFGDPAGYPFFLFHGIPGSRCGAGVVADQAARRGFRVIGIDRPGIGLSTFQRNRAFLDWPRDVTELADSLGFARFGVVGNSGGSAYVAACALLIPERITFAGIVSGMGPIDIPDWQQALGLPRTRRMLAAMARRAPRVACRLAAPLLVRDFDPKREGVLERMKTMMAPADRLLLDQPSIARTVLRDASEAIRQGTIGVTWDLMLYTRPWGFRLQDVKTLVHLWHGEADVTVPPCFGRALAGALPHCRATFWPGEGHLMIVSRVEQIIDTIATSLDGARSHTYHRRS